MLDYYGYCRIGVRHYNFLGLLFIEMFGFGSKLAVSGIIDTIYKNLYLIVIGKNIQGG